jgi:hypothetical protein
MLGVVLAGLVVAAGCSGGSERASSGPATSSTAPAIPPVVHPLEVSGFAADPCALLGESQRHELGLPAAGRGSDAGSSTCDLHADPARKDSSNYLRLVVFEGAGLADQYKQCGTLDCSQWTIDDIDGYPVVRATDEMTAKYGSCKLLVGVADDAVVAVIDVKIDPSADGPECDRADQAASMALATLS